MISRQTIIFATTIAEIFKQIEMLSIEIAFWVCAFVVFYTYAGYGLLLYLLVRIKEAVSPQPEPLIPAELPEVTLLVAAYNEEEVVAQKMENTLQLDYPQNLLRIVWVTDGSTDSTNDLLCGYGSQVRILFEKPRRGKSAALNRAVPHIDSPIVVFTDANTMLGRDSVREIVRLFADAKVGCVSGEKKIIQQDMQDATAGEGLYWRYESTLKKLDYRLYSAVGAAGELFAIRRELFTPLPDDTLLDDFVLSLTIARKGYRIAYTEKAYALESASADIAQEAKRKVRIAAGGLQSIWRLRGLLNIFRYGTLSFQYISHRVLRWTLTPLLWFAMLPLNVILAWDGSIFYTVLLALQLLFYAAALGGYILSRKSIKNKALFVPYYFLFMNVCVFRGVAYLMRNKGRGVWEKARRAPGTKQQ